MIIYRQIYLKTLRLVNNLFKGDGVVEKKIIYVEIDQSGEI